MPGEAFGSHFSNALAFIYAAFRGAVDDGRREEDWRLKEEHVKNQQ